MGLYGISNVWCTICDNFSECDSQGRLIDTDKWDNHNTIARGWLTSGEDHYQPVTFRRIYGAKTPSMQQPIAASPMPNTTTEMAHPPNNNVVPVDYPEEECADLWSNKDIFRSQATLGCEGSFLMWNDMLHITLCSLST